jgi:hypothetical protein
VAVYTINPSTTNWGRVVSYGNYANARAGSGTKTLDTSNTGFAGQYYINPNYYCVQSFLSFDTSSVVGTIVSASLEIYIESVTQNEAYDLQARLYNFGTSVTTADFVAGSSLSSQTLLADKDPASLSNGAYYALDDVALAANINQSGSTRILFCSSDQVNNDAPSTTMGVPTDKVAFTNPSGTNPPKLIITTADSANGDLAQTIANFTLSATATRTTNGAFSQSFGDFTISAAGAVGGAGQGVLAQSIGDFTISFTAARITNCYLDSSFGDFTLAATSVLPVAGELSQSIGDFTLDAYSLPEIEGELTASIGDFTLSATSTGANQGVLSSSIGNFILVAVESGPAWPSLYDFPQSPLDGTWRRERGDDTLRTEREVGARQYRARNGGNYADATFAILVTNKLALDLLDRFFRDDCKNGATPFYWIDPETGDNLAWLWASPPQIRHVARETYRVECALLKEAA